MTETEEKIMKKILIATTALVATAGVAAADVKLSGYARFGAQYNEGAATETTPVSRVRWQLDASTTTDAGVGLNVRQRIQSEENGTNDTNGGRFGLTYGGLAVNVGNINGVIESTPNLYMRSNSAGVGLEGNGFHSLATNNAGGSWGWTAYSSAGAGATDGVEVIYSANGLRLHAHDTDGSTAYGASYAMGDVTVAAGYEDLDAGGSITLITAGMNIGEGWAAIAHGINESAAGVDVSKTSLKGGYNVAPGTSVYGFVASEDAGDASGVGVSMDLGGGASFDAGYTNTAASLGVLSAGVFFTF
jgi:outer membrane protein OmpU